MKVVLSGNLKRFTSFEDEVQLDVGSVAEGLDMLVERFPELKPVIFDSDGKLRSVHRLYFNGEVLKNEELDHLTLGPKDELGILTAIAGG